MKRIYSFLALMLSFVIGVVSAQAADYYEAVGFNTGGQLTTITPGQEVVLQSASDSRPDFMNGLGKSHTVVKEAIYVFEEAGTDAASGQMTYILKQKYTNKYLANGMMTDAKSQAFVFRANLLTADNWYTSSTVPENADPFTTAIYDDAHYGGAPAEKAWVFCKAGSTAEEFSYIASYWYDGAVSFWNYKDTNTWQIFAIQAVGGYKKLEAAMNTLFPEGKTVDMVFKKGNAVGEVPAEFYDAFEAAYASALELFNAGSDAADPALCEEAADAVAAAYDVCLANRIKLEDGYVLIRVNKAKYPSGYWYTDGSNTKWSTGTNWEKPETFTAADAKYIWKITKDPNVTDGYKMQNFLTSTYVGFVDAQSKVIPQAETDAQTYVVKASNINGHFNVIPTQKSAWSAHAQSDGNLVFWGLAAEASSWTFEYVDAAVIEALQSEVDKIKLADKVSDLVVEAKTAIANAYSLDNGQDLLVDVSQVWSNAKETAEGSYEALLDNNNTTFFHSSWSNPGIADVHNLIVDIVEPAQEIAINYVKRTENVSRAPLSAVLYGANEIAPGDSLGGNSWTKLDEVYFAYPDTAMVNGTQKDNWKGGILLQLPAPYRYLRFDMNNNSSGSKFFTFAEFHAQTVAIKENSPINAVPSETLQALKDAIATAKAAAADTTATQADYDNLLAALEAFNAAVPDPSALIALLEEAKTLASAMQEGDQLGYFATGSQADALAKIAAVEPQISEELRSVATIKDLTTQVQAIIDGIHASLNKPTDGVYYRIKAKGGAAADNVLYAKGNGQSEVRWDGSKDNTDFNACLEYVWKAIANEDGTYSFQNALYGNYLGINTSGKDSQPILMTEEPQAIPLEFSGTIGTFNFAQGEGKFANSDPQGNLVTWWDRAGNSLFTIEEADGFEGYQHIAATTDAPKFMTLPVEVAGADGASLYEVIGIKDQATLELALVESVPAGRPFVAINESAEAGFYLILAGTTPEEVAANGYATEAASHNGLIGVLAADTIAAGQGVLANGTIINSGTDEVVAANTAWLSFTETPVTTEVGDAQIALDESIKTGADMVVVRQLNDEIFDLQGRKVSKAQKGLFIVNGKKVLVK